MKILIQLEPLRIEKVKSGFNQQTEKAFFLFDSDSDAEKFLIDHFRDEIIKAKNQLRKAENNFFEAFQVLKQL